jgi:hypothetical protein
LTPTVPTSVKSGIGRGQHFDPKPCSFSELSCHFKIVEDWTCADQWFNEAAENKDKHQAENAFA